MVSVALPILSCHSVWHFYRSIRRSPYCLAIYNFLTDFNYTCVTEMSSQSVYRLWLRLYTVCAHGCRFRAFSKTFSSLLSFWRPVYTDQGKIFSMYWISSNFCSKLLVFAWKHKWKRSKTLPCARTVVLPCRQRFDRQRRLEELKLIEIQHQQMWAWIYHKKESNSKQRCPVMRMQRPV